MFQRELHLILQKINRLPGAAFWSGGETAGNRSERCATSVDMACHKNWFLYLWRVIRFGRSCLDAMLQKHSKGCQYRYDPE